MSNPFFANSLKQSQQMSNEAHSPLAPRNSGTPIRESRMMNVGATIGASQRKSNADTPTLHSGPSQHLNSIMASSIASNSQHGQASYPQAKQSSFGSVFYDSNRKTRESNAMEENRLK